MILHSLWAGAARWKSSVAAVILANLWELAGVLFFGWNAFLIAYIYWAENVVVGLFNVPRMILARWSGHRHAFLAEKLMGVPFFLIHFGGFTLGHGFALSAIGKHFAPGAGKQISGSAT